MHMICLVTHKRAGLLLTKIYHEISGTGLRLCNAGKQQAAERLWTGLSVWSMPFHGDD